MINKIDNEFIKSLRPCTDRHLNYLNHYKDTSFSWFEFLNLKNITTNDKIWVFARKIAGIEGIQREFAIRVAARAVDRVNVPELNDYFTLVLFMLESGDWGLKDSEEYRATYIAADIAAGIVANEAACRAAHYAAHYAADYAAYWAANGAANYVAEREQQLNILKQVTNS